MSSAQRVSEHYLHGDLLSDIQTSLAELGKTPETVSLDDLAAVDEFHIGGRAATDHFIHQLKLTSQSRVLDIGCGLGGAARFVASTYGSHVTGIDLSKEYIETGKTLCVWTKLDSRVHLQQASALAIPFQDQSFDRAYMMHIGMNIKDKTELFAEVYRVLRPESVFGIYDIMRLNDGKLNYPVPWAGEEAMSHLATPEHYKRALHEAGFEVETETNRHTFAVDFFKTLRQKTEVSGGPPPLGLHTLMKETTAVKIKNMVDGVMGECIAPVEIIAYKV